MPKRLTHKRRPKTAKKPRTVLTIPELRKSLEHIQSQGNTVVQKHGNKKEAASAFAAEWKKTFGKTLPTAEAESYLAHLEAMKGKPKRGKHTRKLRGGSMLSGAPLATVTRPGVDLPQGNFLEQVNKGFWNPEPAISWDCGKQTGVLPQAETGSNKMNGGGILDSITNAASAFSFRPFIAQNPTTAQYDAQTAWKGQPLGPGPESYQRAQQQQMPPNPITPIVMAPVQNRTLSGADVVTR